MEKIEYIANQFKKTFNKKYENYCITKIINKLDDQNIKFITQQMFKKSNGKIALADLYFPQINIWVEINEAHHKYQKKEDRNRIKEIKKNDIRKKSNSLEEIKYDVLEDPDVVEIYDSNGMIRKDIDVQIDQIVNKIKLKIKKMGSNYKPWVNVFETPQEYIKKGYIDVKDDVKLRYVQDVSDLFNKKYKANRRSYFPINKDANIYCWCPKVKIEKKEFENNLYENIIKNEGEYILEVKKEDNEEFFYKALDSNEIRYVFCYYKDESLKYMYKFRGVYELDKEKSRKSKVRTWKRIRKTAEISCYFN